MTFVTTLFLSTLLVLIHSPIGLAETGGSGAMRTGTGASVNDASKESKQTRHQERMNPSHQAQLPARALSSGSREDAVQATYSSDKDPEMPNGVIGVSLQVGAERVGDPAVLYVGMVHPEGPAHDAGLAHGDEITTVDGTAVSGKSYQELAKMIRGAVGTSVKLGVKGEAGSREVSIPRVPSENLSNGPDR